MVVVTLTPEQFADLLRVYSVTMLPVAVGGYCYAVVHSPQKPDLYRVAVA